MAIPTQATAATPNRRPPSPYIRIAVLQFVALVFTIMTASAAQWISGQSPASGVVCGLLFGRISGAWLFRLDRLRWGEWGIQDARLWIYVTTCGSAMALPMLTAQNVTSSGRFLMTEALIYGVYGLLIDDVARIHRRRVSQADSSEVRPCFVYGSRGAGRQLAQGLIRHPEQLAPFAYLDDDPCLQNTVIDGLPVVGHLDDLARLAQLHAVYDIVASQSDGAVMVAANEAGVDIHTDASLHR